MDVSDLLNDLNDAQRDAVAAPPGHMLVLAGAGSGKTRVLVHRIAWLIQVERVSPHAILAVTFTNKAAREMRHRIEDMLGIPTRGLWIGTFHGLAHRLLKMHWQEAGLVQNFQIIDSDDQLRLIKRIVREQGLDDSQWQPRTVQSFINSHKDEGKRAAHIDSYGDYYQRTMQALYQAYEEVCQRSGLVDFAEILLRSHELWLKKPDVLAQYRKRFSHILVDEFQDTNTVQYAWLRVLAGSDSQVVAVGDDDQSIYGWRGARIENIQRFSEDFPVTRIVRLEQNYRSTATILKAANAVIDNNPGRLGKELWTAGEQGEPIELYAAFNEYDEARHVVDRIADLLRDEQCRRQDIAVLYRSNAQSRVLEEAFLRANMPYHIYGGQRFYERLEIKHAMAYLKLIANRLDDAAFERVVNTPARGIGNKTLEQLRQFARDHGCSLWQAVDGLQAAGELPGRALNALLQFRGLIDALDEKAVDLVLEELVEQVIAGSGLLAMFEKEKGETGKNRIDNLQELVNAAASFDQDDSLELSPLQQFLDTAALDAGEGQADDYVDSVQLMTLHSAKGLEFLFVFLVGMEENLFPSRMSLDEPGRLEEERRLCYVGITRAMRKLFLSYAETRRVYGDESHNPVSRFVREIPAELLHEVRMQQAISWPVSARTQRPAVAQQVGGLALGQRVFHNTFGEGVVLQFEGQADNARVQVNFDRQGSKWLVLQYAKLEVL
ncbi:MAG TPA: DNA helicase II [Pseudomonadales bacterium]